MKITDAIQVQNTHETASTTAVNTATNEDTTLRGRNIKVFNLGGAVRQAVVYAAPVHFRDDDGQWQDIDNTLEKTATSSGRNVLRNHVGRVRVEFPVCADGHSMATLSDGNRTFAWRFEQTVQPVSASVRTGLQLHKERLIRKAKTLPKFAHWTQDELEMADLSAELEGPQEQRATLLKLNAETLYENVMEAVSVRYSLNGESLKEDIILANSEALSHAAIRLPKDYAYEVTDQSELHVRDTQTGKALFVMEMPLVYDAEGRETIAQIELTDAGEYVVLRYRLDEAFLSEAIFPVTIDPVVRTATTDAVVSDAYIWKKRPDNNYGSVHLMRCGLGEGGESIALVKFEKTVGSRMPVAVKHVYNSCLSENNAVSCGNGWRTTLHQQVNRQSIDSTNYYIWRDGSAAEHYFAISGSQPYKDAEGMGLKLTTTDGVQLNMGYAQSNTFSASVANQLTSTSKLQKAVANRLTNVDFSSGWTTIVGNTGDTAAQDKSTRCLNMPSLKLTKTGSAETRHTQTLNSAPAGEYTFSAYVKNTTVLTDGGLFLRIRYGDNTWESRKLTDITANRNTGSAADGWDRLYVTATLIQTAYVTLELVSTATSGSAWFACPQFGQGSIPNRVNLLVNGDFTYEIDNSGCAFYEKRLVS